MLTTAVVAATATPAPQQPQQSRLTKSLKALEARRVARVKSVTARLVKTLKHADTQARELLAEDLRDAADALLPEPAPKPESVHD